MKKALIGMSGGVDSSVAAHLMKKNGFECIGATMCFFDASSVISPDKACGVPDDARDAKTIAERLGMEHYVLDFKDEFRKCVIDRFVSVYEEGNTPNPCIECNKYLKFGAFFDEAEKMGCDFVSTGHYAVAEKNSVRCDFEKSKGRIKGPELFSVFHKKRKA